MAAYTATRVIHASVVVLLVVALQFHPTECHVRRSCRTNKLPVVVLERTVATNGAAEDESSSFRVIERYSADQFSQAQTEFPNATTRRLQADDPLFQTRLEHRQQYHFLRSSFKENKDFVPALRLLHAGHDHNDTTSAATDSSFFNSTTSKDPNLLLARECECFIENVNEVVFCPFATNKCRQVIDNHQTLQSDGDVHPESVYCFDEALKRGDTNTHRYLWLVVFVAWGMFVAIVLLTSHGRSCMSFVPSRILGLCCCFRWNDHVADYLLRHRPERAKAMIRHHIVVRRAQEYRRYRRIWRRQQQEQQQQESGEDDNNNQTQETDHIELVVTPNGNVVPSTDDTGDAAAETTARRTPTSLALKTKVYDGIIDKDFVTMDPNDNDVDDDECAAAQCAICFGDLVAGKDRVGVLPCQHVFHVDPCLKGWLARGNNSCPTCRTANVATARYDDDDEETVAKNEEEADNGGTESLTASEQTDSVSGSENTAARAVGEDEN